MKACISHCPGAKYPNASDYYSPDVRYPEYRYDHIATIPNRIYDMVRETFIYYGLDSERFGTPDWNPLGEFITEGSSVFILCNFVSHRSRAESKHSFLGKCTHASVLRALLDYVVLAVGSAGEVRFGNAPLQSADWDRVIVETGAAKVLDFYRHLHVDVQAKDLRLLVTRRGITGRTLESVSRDEMERGVEIGLDDASLLSSLNSSEDQLPNFRIADYDPKRMQVFHSNTQHRYIVSREILSADTIISLPKLKTHEKVGVTCGLKGFVGIVGHKDCLPHHRFGGPLRSGDEYPYNLALLRWCSTFTDRVQSVKTGRLSTGILQMMDHSLRRLLRRTGLITSGAWYGNDTCWRMALDMARIAHYADSSGTMHDNVHRKHLVLIDGIVAGEGNGPLKPKPVNSGVLVFSDNVAAGDWVACRLMGFEPKAIPLVCEAFGHMKYPLCSSAPSQIAIEMNGKPIEEAQLRSILGRPFLPPRGWRGHFERSRL